MKRFAIIVSACAAVLAGAVFARSAAAFPNPVLDFSVGKSMGVDGVTDVVGSNVTNGGLTVSVSPMWPVGERAHFGVSWFADDMGSTRDSLFDRTSNTALGVISTNHRMVWGLGWRGDYDVVHRSRWAVAVSGTTGWWRVQDDLRGTALQAASAVGLGLGAEVRGALTAHHEFGIAVRYHELTADRHASYHRVDHYATAALTWRWIVDKR